MAIAEFKGLRFEYEEEHLDIHQLPEITHDDAKALLFKVKELFDAMGIDFYLSYGTLLGAVREGDFIKGDLDIDVYSKEEGLIFNNLQHLKENGVELIRYVKNNIFSFRYRDVPGAYLDVYVWRKPLDVWWVYCDCISSTRIPRKLLNEAGTIWFLGAEFKCVKDPVALLKFWYGDTWNVPLGKFEKTYKYDVASHYYFIKLRVKVGLARRKILRKLKSIFS